MLDEKAIKYLRDLDCKNPEMRFQDFTNEELRECVRRIDPDDWKDIREYFLERTIDKDVEAHLLGFKDNQQRQMRLKEIEELQESMRLDTPGVEWDGFHPDLVGDGLITQEQWDEDFKRIMEDNE